MIDRKKVLGLIFRHIGEALEGIIEYAQKEVLESINQLQAAAGESVQAEESGQPAALAPEPVMEPEAEAAEKKERKAPTKVKVLLSDGKTIEAALRSKKTKRGQIIYYIRRKNKLIRVVPDGDEYRERAKAKLNLETYRWKPEQIEILKILNEADKPIKLQDIAKKMGLDKWRSLVGHSRALAQAEYTDRAPKGGLVITEAGQKFLAERLQAEQKEQKPAPSKNSRPRRRSTRKTKTARRTPAKTAKKGS